MEVTKAHINTALIPVHAEIRELKQGQQELKQGQERLERRLERVEQKLDKVAQDHEERIERLEDHTGIHKN